MNKADYGQVLDYGTVTRRLRELNPDIHFDMGEALGLYAMQNASPAARAVRTRHAGVYYHGRHVASMDRGEIPEYKVWTVVEAAVEIPPVEAAQHEFAWTQWNEVFSDSPEYAAGCEKALTFSDGYAMETGKDGSPMLKKYRGYMMSKSRGKVLKLGWRHTFERLLFEGIPGVTRQSVAEKFGVDMMKFPIGAPEELADALIAE